MMLKRLSRSVRSRQWMLAARLAALALVVAALPACSLFGKEDIIPDDAADKLYNEGLYLLNNKRDYRQAAKRLCAPEEFSTALLRLAFIPNLDVVILVVARRPITAVTPRRRRRHHSIPILLYGKLNDG